MTSSRYILRYSVPGAIFMLALAATYVLMRLGQNFPPASENVGLYDAVRPLTNLSPILAVAAALPLGFGCYQLYYRLYRPERPFGLVRANRGYEVIRHLSDDQRRALASIFRTSLAPPVEFLREHQKRLVNCGYGEMLEDPFSCPAVRVKSTWWPHPMLGWFELVPPLRVPGHAVDEATTKSEELADHPAADIAGVLDDFDETPWDRDDLASARALYALRWRAHQRIAAIILDAVTMAERTETIRQQWTDVTDIFHALGAARTAVVAGTSTGLVVTVLQFLLGRAQNSIGAVTTALVVGIVMCLLTFLGVLVLNNARCHAYQRSTERLGFGLRAALTAHPEILRYLAAQSEPAVDRSPSHGSPDTVPDHG